MRNRLTILATPLAWAFLAIPIAAQTTVADISRMTCGELSKLDRAGKMQVVDQHMMLSAYGKLASADRNAMEMKLGIRADMTSAEKDEKIVAAMRAGMAAGALQRTAEETAASTAAAERHLMNLEAACRGKDEMIVGEIID